MRSFCCTRRAGRGQPVLFHAARPPQLSRAGYHRGDPRWAAAARFNGRNAPRALTSAACLARPADPARLCLSPIRIQRLTYAEPGEVLTSSGPSWHCRHCISLTAVLEFGPTETLPPVGAISKHPASLPTRSPIHPPRPARKAGFSTFESGCGRERDCLLEGDGFELVWGFSCQVVVLGFAESSLFGAGKPFFIPSPAIRFPERAEGVKGPKR